MKNAQKFIENIKSEDEILVIFNNDADGICSCVIVAETLKRMGKKKPFIISQPMPTDKNLIKRIQMTYPNKIIFLDLAIDQQNTFMKKLGGICDILIIDHHQIIKNMNNPPHIVHFNPRIDDPRIYQSTSYLTYKVYSDIAEIDDLLWVSAVGMIGDYDLSYSKDLVKKVMKKYDIVENLYESYLGRIADMISAAEATKMLSCERIVDIFQNTKNPKELLNMQEFTDPYKEIEKEMSLLMEDFETKAERINNIIFYNIKSKYKLSSQLSTRLSGKYPNKTVIIYEIKGNRVKISARNQAKKGVGELLKKASYGLKASAGGHEAAAGATLKAEDWNIFKEKLVKLAK